MGVQGDDAEATPAVSSPVDAAPVEAPTPTPTPAPAATSSAEAEAAPAPDAAAAASPASPTSPAFAIGPAECSVVLTGLSANVTEQMVLDFVEFCGDVEKYELRADKEQEAEGAQFAIVEFVDASSVDDALICTGAVIGDSTVTIARMVVIDVTPDTLDKVVTRAKTTGETVTKVVAAGYIKGEAAIDVVKQKAKDFDATHKISDKVKDAKLGEKAKVVATTVTGVATGVHAKVMGKPKEFTEEQKQEYQTAGVRTWKQQPADAQPQW